MTRRSRKQWSYSAGEHGRNRVRAFEREDGIFIEYRVPRRDAGYDRKRVKLQPEDQTRERAKRKADELAATFATLTEQRTGPATLAMLMDHYLMERTPAKGRSKQRHDHAAHRVWLAFLREQEPARRPDRSPSTLDRIDWDRFVAWRSAGRIPGWERDVGPRTVALDLKWLLSVLIWATGARPTGGAESYLSNGNPWASDIRRSQRWQMPRERTPLRPVMTPEVEALLLEHSPGWQFRAVLLLAGETGRRRGAIARLDWRDVNFEARTIRWRRESDKADREIETPMVGRCEEVLRSIPRGISGPMFPSATDASVPTPDSTFDVWMRRAKRAVLDSIGDDVERGAMRERLRGLGYHAQKRARVRSPEFRALPDSVRELLTGTDASTLHRVYDSVGVEDARAAFEAAKQAVSG